MMNQMGLAGMAKMKGGAEPPMQEEQQQQGDALGDEENLDAEIAENLGMKLMQTPEAQQTLQGAVGEGGDPVAKLGVFFSQLIDKIQTKFDSTDTPLSPRIWLSQGGVLDSWIEDLSEAGLLTPDLAEPVKTEVVNVLKLQEQSVGPGGGPSQTQMMEEEGQGPMPQMMGMPQGGMV